MPETLAALAERGIKVKVITGDNRYVAKDLAGTIGLAHLSVLRGAELNRYAAAPQKCRFGGQATSSQLLFDSRG